MDHRQLLALFDREMRIDIEYPGGRKEVLPHLVRFMFPKPRKNFILYSSLDGGNVDALIQEQINDLTQYEQPFEWVVYDHDRPAGLVDRLIQHGFDRDPEPGALMVLDLHEAPPALLAPVTASIRPITRRDQLGEVVRIEERVWGENFDWIPARFGPELEIPGFLNMYVADVDGVPASAAWVFFYPGSQFAGLYGGGTVPEYRGRGLYTALLAARAQEALRRSRRYLFIDAGPMSRPIVAKHGFQLLSMSSGCNWKG